MKTLINTLYISLLIVAPLFISSMQPSESAWSWFWFGVCAIMLSPLALALIQTAHKITISVLNIAAIGGVALSHLVMLNRDPDLLYQIWIAQGGGWWLLMLPLPFIFLLWIWQCFDGRRPAKLHA